MKKNFVQWSLNNTKKKEEYFEKMFSQIKEDAVKNEKELEKKIKKRLKL